MLVQVSPQRWGPTSFLSHLTPVLLTFGLTWLLQSCHYICIPASGTENNTSIWKWHITPTQIPLGEVSSMIMANLGVVDTQKGRGMWSYFRTFMMSYKGHHPSFISLYSLFFCSPHTALCLFWPADMDMDEVIREDMAQAVQIWREQEWKEDMKV